MMTSKQPKSRTSTKQSSPKLAAKTQPQTHPAALAQRANFAQHSLSANNMLQLQGMIGNQALSQLMPQTTPDQPVQRKRSTELEAGGNGSKERGQPLKNRLKRSTGKTMIQRCKGQEDGSTVSSFDESIRLDKDTEHGKVGDGGALTVYLSGSSPFFHREVTLEWYDGYAQTGRHLAVHLATPDLAVPGGNVLKQLGSFFPRKDDDRMESIVQEFGTGWDPNYRASHNSGSRTVPLTEEQKEEKRHLLEGEIGKTYRYDIMNLGILNEKGMNCKDWAQKVAPEAII